MKTVSALLAVLLMVAVPLVCDSSGFGNSDLGYPCFRTGLQSYDPNNSPTNSGNAVLISICWHDIGGGLLQVWLETADSSKIQVPATDVRTIRPKKDEEVKVVFTVTSHGKHQVVTFWLTKAGYSRNEISQWQ